MGFVERLDRAQRRFPLLGFPIAVAYKYFDDIGGYLSALLTYYAFVSLFPLLLLLATALSFVLSGRPDLQRQILDSAVAQVPVLGDQLGDPRSLSGGASGVAIGLAVSVYGALGVGNALQHAMNTVWAVPRNVRPNPVLARARSVVLVLTAGLAVLATTALSAFTAAATTWGPWTKVLSTVLTILVNAFIVLLVFRIGVRQGSIRKMLPGALLAAGAWQGLQTFGVVYVGRVVKNASTSNGVVAFILGLLAFTYLAAVILVLCAEVNVVRAERLYPRALLTPFTDDVDLTAADEETYADQARSMRTKGYERIDVTFEPEESGDAQGERGAAGSDP